MFNMSEERKYLNVKNLLRDFKKNNLKKVSYLFSFSFFIYIYNWERDRDFAVCKEYIAMNPGVGLEGGGCEGGLGG